MPDKDHLSPRPSDVAMYCEVFGTYGHLPRADAVRRVAHERSIPERSVSRMVIRAGKDRNIHRKLLEYLKQPSHTTPASQRIQHIIAQARHEQSVHHRALRGLQYAVFISDIHFPRARLDALQLYYDIIADLQPAYISALNDALDFPTLSDHVDRRTLSDRQLDSDISQAMAMYQYHLRAESDIAPGAAQVAIVGNHEDRLMRHINSGVTEYNAANVMSDLANAGVLFLDSIERENAFALNSTLVWAHGWSAAASQAAVARHALDAASRWLGNPRTLYDVVTGHTHRTAITRQGPAIHYNSGCMCDLNPYYTRRKPNWQLGITISQFDPHGSYHDTQIVEFLPLRDRLIARYNGKTYATKLGY